ncbi:MAG TPA: hypothetical protein VG013_33410 [Gemmataceae bacterium]|nr:hypothetical protein [Gemmataceae bacterium]
MSAWADDSWAAATEDPLDDISAAENNEYLPGGHADLQTQLECCAQPPVAILDTCTCDSPPPWPVFGRWLEATASAPFGPAALYVLMSFQR